MKGGESVKCIIDGEPKEIAALVLELQERQDGSTQFSCFDSSDVNGSNLVIKDDNIANARRSAK